MPSENNDRKYYLVRTDRDLAEKSIVGIGWSDFNFSNYSDTEKLIKDIDKGCGIGRAGNQIRRFIGIAKGDIIIVPLLWSVVIGEAKEGIFYDKNYYYRDKANQRYVTFDFDKKNENLITINRINFSEALQRRLKVPGITVNDISEFKNEIDSAVASQKEGKIFSSANLLVQVKHHQGISGEWGLKQLEEIRKLSQKDYSDHVLIFVTSAEVTTDLRKKAESLSFIVIDGHGMADWIYENLNKLELKTKIKLGICEVPALTSPY
ncbi:MAG: restriction endonuclease [Planctomycetota bacterium]|jgi:predicted Mrr-cat superfamily restriction endonuclease